MAAVSVIVPARDAAGTLGALLDGLARQDLEARPEVIVVDDGSRDDTAAIAARHPATTRAIRRPRGGAAAARNAGVAVSTAPLLAFTDADCVPAPGWLRAALAALTCADLVQGRVLPDPATPRTPFDRTVAVERETGLYETANLLVRRAWFDRAGGFEDLVATDGRPFGEDTWFAWRARRAGARTAFASDALVHHAVLPGTRAGLLEERRRLRLFPALVARVPELRGEVLHRRLFLSPRTLAFDLALAGLLAAGAARSPLPLLAAAPYARRLRATGHGPLTHLAGDALGAASLLHGSAAARTLVL